MVRSRRPGWWSEAGVLGWSVGWWFEVGVPGWSVGRWFEGSGSGSESGLGARLEAALGVLESVVSELDPARLTGEDATELYGSLVGLERLTNAGKTLARPPDRGLGDLAGAGPPRAPR